MYKAQGREHQDRCKDNGSKDAGDRRGVKSLYDMLDNIKEKL